jgi:hypothetical protein
VKRLALAAAAACCVLLLPALVLGLLMVAAMSPASTVVQPVAACQPATSATWDGEQLANAAIIEQVGRQRGVPSRGWVIALATAAQESGLRNLPYGDRDSLGLFQQRASWGSVAQRLDPVWSSGKFFGSLEQVAGWERLPVTDAAQAVQRSAYPDAYARWEAPAQALVDGTTGCQPPAASTTDCPPSGLAVETGLQPNAVTVVRCEVAKWGIVDLLGIGQRDIASDHPLGLAVDVMVPAWQTPAGNALGWQVAHWVQANAAAFGVTYVIFDAHIWSVARDGEGWRPYRHPGGGADPTSMHLNHVHVSVVGG